MATGSSFSGFWVARTVGSSRMASYPDRMLEWGPFELTHLDVIDLASEQPCSDGGLLRQSNHRVMSPITWSSC